MEKEVGKILEKPDALTRGGQAGWKKTFAVFAKKAKPAVISVGHPVIPQELDGLGRIFKPKNE